MTETEYKDTFAAPGETEFKFSGLLETHYNKKGNFAWYFPFNILVGSYFVPKKTLIAV